MAMETDKSSPQTRSPSLHQYDAEEPGDKHYTANDAALVGKYPNYAVTIAARLLRGEMQLVCVLKGSKMNVTICEMGQRHAEVSPP